MKPSFIVALALCIPACTVPSATAWDVPSKKGPVLIGVVRQPNGIPMANVLVTPYGGFATRFPGIPTRTDQKGRYRFSPVHGSWMESESGEGSDLYVGVCVGPVPVGANTDEFSPWQDVRIQNEAGVVEQLDFIYRPARKE
jgi:hypothetical protein